MSDIVFTDENALDFLHELEPLFPAHWEELCPHKEFPFDPDVEMYKHAAATGRYRTYTCRHEGEVIGYAAFFVHPNPHYKSCLTAVEDLYYLKPEYRKGGVGAALFKFCEKALKAFGVQRIIIHTKVYADHSPLFEHLGYTWTDKLFSKLI